MNFQLQNKLTGGMDADSDSRYVNESDTRFALNIRGGIAYAGKAGVVTNVKGNVEIPYTLPSGDNKCIGAYNDVQANTVIYFIWNSNGNHQIIRYYAEIGRIDLQMQYDFGWTSETNITGIELINGRLLYWNDPKPRKINIEKAQYKLPDGSQKVKQWSLVLPKTISNLTSPYELYFKDYNGNLIFGAIYDPALYTSREEFIQAIAAALNLVSSQSPVNAEACDCSLKLTEKVGGTVWSIESNNPTIVIPVNWYGLTITDRMVDRAKYPPLFEPIGQYQQDDKFLYNYVKDKVFQFRLQYRYDDYENSALGVISQIPIDNLQCDGTDSPEKNYIDVNFNDPALLDQLTYSILTDVNVLAREQNDGNWKQVITLSPCEYLDYDGTSWVASYNFYNDIVSNTVSDSDVSQQYDDVPLAAEENILVKNRAILANVVKGYDAPDCIPATWDVSVSDSKNQKLVKIKGRVRILTYSLAEYIGGGAYGSFYYTIELPNGGYYRKYPFWESNISGLQKRVVRGGIFRDISKTDSYPFFGGGGFTPSNNFEITTGIDTTFDQRIPEGGFPVYAAGTNFLTISKQVNLGGFPVDSAGALDVSTASKISDIGSWLRSNYNGIFPPLDPQTDLYSEFELLVPSNSEYVIRLASHWCSFGDKLNKGFAYDLSGGTEYQKTSTNVWCVYDSNGNQIKQKEITVNVGITDVDCGTFIVSDLAPPNGIGNAWRPINAYLVSSNGDISDINSETFNGVPVEKTVASYGRNGVTYYLDGATTIVQHRDVGWGNCCTTDHNGYFFGIGGEDVVPDYLSTSTTSASKYFPVSAYQAKLGATNNCSPIRDMDTLIYTGTYSEYITKKLSPINYDSISNYSIVSQDLIHGFCAANEIGARDWASTVIDGEIINSSGEKVDGISIIYQNGGISKTNNGKYSIYCWSDMITPNLPYFYLQSFVPYSDYNRLIDNIIVRGDDFCFPIYPNGQEIYPITITPISNNNGDYNPNNHYIVRNFIVDELNDPSKKAHKRGGKYTYGIRYYDENGRFCSVVKAFEMYLPFITQDLNTLCIQDNYALPNQYPVGTYKYGKPTINWHLAPNQKPPTWAHYYQWMRTKNSIYGRYLQWNINSVTYLSAVATQTTPEIQTSYQNADATAIKISISNIVDYSSQNPNSQVGYSFETGDRVRLITTRDLTYIDGLRDYGVVSYDTTTQSLIVKNQNNGVEIKSGMLLEVMNPLSIVDKEEQIYYEVGEVYSCTAPNTPNNQHSVLNGTFTNGDTYWRGRFIPVNDDATNYAAIYPVVIEDASVSDFYPSNSQDIGRAGTIDPNFKQIHYPTMMQNSGTYVEGSALNGLSSFKTYDYKELNRAFGGIKRLFYVGNTLLSIHENKVVANYIELRSLSDANTTDGLLAVSDAYFGNDRPMQSEYGCQHPNSAVQYNGYVYFLDAAKGVVCRTDNNGLDTISDVKMRSFFRQICSQGVSNAVGVFDPYYREYVVSITTPNQQKTIAWNEDKNRWVTFYSFLPERYASVLRSIVSFVDGKIYVHDLGNIYNNFYGVQHRTELTVIAHQDTPKSTFHTVLLQGNQADPLTNDWFIEDITNDYGQRSRLKKQHFRLKENFWCASFLRDLTDTTVANPIINGRNLRGQELVCKFVNDSTDLVALQQVITTVVLSERTPK